MELTTEDFGNIGRILEGFFFGEMPVQILQLLRPFLTILGIYSGIFAIHVHYHASRERTDNIPPNRIVFYALCVLYVLSVALIALDIAPVVVGVFASNNKNFLKLVLISCATER